MQLSTLLFDLDGTLTDSKLGITRCIQHALQTLGMEPPSADDLEWCIGPPLASSFAQLLDTDKAGLIDQALRLYRERFAEVGLYENSVYTGIPDTLASLQAQGFRLFLATAKPRVFAERILDHFQLSPYFEVAFGSELDGQFTDKPSLVRHILDSMVLSPEHTMIIGDRKYDLLGGQANGVHSGAVTYGYGSHEELQLAGAKVWFHAPTDISQTLLPCYQAPLFP